MQQEERTGLYQPLADQERDACGILAVVRRDGKPWPGMVRRALSALVKMQHRAGFVDGEGDGCGLQLDLPRGIWRQSLAEVGLDDRIADSDRLVVGHFFLHRSLGEPVADQQERARRLLARAGFRLLTERTGAVFSDALGPRGRADEPLFWQVAAEWQAGGETPAPSLPAAREAACYRLKLAIEAETPIHVVSLSGESVVYKIRGTASALGDYYPDLSHPACASAFAIGHNRYSTNTTTVFERVQPFSLLGHNGEINTIQKLREEAQLLGIPLIPGASDSQDLNRVFEGLIHDYGWTLMEAADLLFPPIINEIRKLRPGFQPLYLLYRHLWGPFAQGPAAVVIRQGDVLLASVDALGLRPLWQVVTEEEVSFSSEAGIVPVEEMVEEPKPLAPGEKAAVVVRRGEGSRLLSYPEIQEEILSRASARFQGIDRVVRSIDLPREGEAVAESAASAEPARETAEEKWLAAWGWEVDDVKMVEHLASTGAEPIGSLGYDGPLAVLSQTRQNLADYFKESVAVVTNPAIDREREIEHFSTRSILGCRPDFRRPVIEGGQVEVRIPILLGGHAGPAPLPRESYREVAREWETFLLEDLLAAYGEPGAARLRLTFTREEGLRAACERLGAAAVQAVRNGAELILLDDAAGGWGPGELPIDGHLAISVVDLALKRAEVPPGEQNLRRRASLLLRAGSLRNLHDICVALGLGADAVNPYLMIEVAAQGADGARQPIANLCSSLQKGMEKVISTIGIHELRGYDRLFSAIGLRPDLARALDCPNACGSDRAGFGFEELEAELGRRAAIARGEEEGKLSRAFRMWPRAWKLAGDLAAGQKGYEEYAQRLAQIEAESPISLRHLLDVRPAGPALDPSQVDIGVGRHDLPFTISSMSFGSQGETAYRAYAEAAYRLNMIGLNGEGGEIKDLLGRYPENRGIQVASGRFGINVEVVNSCNLLEIKIGQGAKPGEGGHLPGRKVSAKVAAARNATVGVDLISPSNNHDIYSIEDLAQIVEELKTANPRARVAVKVPIVPNIGTIAVGIAKSGADIVTLSGFDGGTGAARLHALKHVGLPTEIGVAEAHRALVEAGIRDQVEVWCDGGLKSAADVVKMMCLGANRVGFATLAMVAVGCTTCRGCQLDTCHVGIATQIETMEEAREKGLKRFHPREFELAVENLVRFFGALGEGLRQLCARLGVPSAQALVGRADLLVQARGLDRIDLSPLIADAGWRKREPYRAIPPLKVPNTRRSYEIADRIEPSLGNGVPAVYEEAAIASENRALGTAVAGLITRRRYAGEPEERHASRLRFSHGSVPGNGLAVFNAPGLEIEVQGGAQDGVGKLGFGGRVRVMKSSNRRGRRVYGSVGKSFCYGAQRGLFIVQGDADSRAGIRLSGADVVIGGELSGPVRDDLGMIATRANIKGFAFEYMTNGRALVMGDPGPWICSGMTGGSVYLRIIPELGLDEAAIRRRLAKGANVKVLPLSRKGEKDVTELLSEYALALQESGQGEKAAEVRELLAEPSRHFLMVVPVAQQTDPTISTE